MGMIEELNTKINDGEASYVEKGIQPTFTWETAVGYLTHCADNDIGEPVNILTYKLPAADEIDSIKRVREFLSESLDKEILGVDLYVSLSTRLELKYKSNYDILLWNPLGSGRFVLRENVRLLSPGDLIFVPRGVEYSVKPETAQCLCVFSLQ